MKRIRLLWIVSDVTKSLQFEGLAALMDKQRYEVRFLLLSKQPGEFADELRKLGFSVRWISANGMVSLPKLFLYCLFYMLQWRPQIVHTHLRLADLAGMTASWLLRVPARIQTRHHSTMNHVYHPHAVRYDKWVSARATRVVAISNTMRQVLVDRERVPEAKVSVVPHGFRMASWTHVPEARVQALRVKYQLPEQAFVVGMASRFTELKGITYAIRAFEKLRRTRPDAFFLLANAQGDHATLIQAELDQLPPGSWLTIPFETDAPALFHMMDVFIHVPVDPDIEGYGMVYIEAMATARACVFTLSGIANDVAVNGETALVVPYRDAEAIAAALLRLATDSALCKYLGQKAQATIVSQFTMEQQWRQLDNLYRQETRASAHAS